ncbi:hypothetical protein EJ02DRAFT_406893 [Clathrospora elynae]|uniref:C2H2-type domain-containing protein n=1 Tax=Clathrospora elynae TaxID=706981 RepID=A0A6A5SJD6_9PLEO|nr:hypothetical protein EJ02DRAFT_406893 [Clathrospora elynae]
MAAHQFGDLPQIQGMDDPRLIVWAADLNNYMQPYKHHEVSFRTDEEIYFNDFDNGIVSMQPMQRFMIDQCPLTPGMLHAKIPLNGRYERYYEQRWPSVDCFRHISPDRTSSGNSSHNTQDEYRSPHMYHTILYGSPMEYSQSSLPYPTTEHFHGGSCSPETPVFDRSISLRELEYEHPEPEPIVEEVDEVDMKKKVVCDHVDNVVKTETTPNYREYADSGIGHSVRDAQSVEPLDFPEEPASDSDYIPSFSRSGKRRRSSTSTASSGRAQRRRTHSRKYSHVTSPAVSTRSPKSARGASSVSRGTTDASSRADDRRPFPCPLAAYGCTSKFSSKNEWKRHVSTQHIKLGYWRCDLCPPSTDPNDEQTFYYNEFNRKDLFTQHLRRMHAAPKDASVRNQKEHPVTEENLPEHQARCNLPLRSPPQHSSCLFCERIFEGSASWEERMEHVGRHLEKDRKSHADMLDVATWISDKKLEQYLFHEGLIVRDDSGWRIGDGKPRKCPAVDRSSESED